MAKQATRTGEFHSTKSLGSVSIVSFAFTPKPRVAERPPSQDIKRRGATSAAHIIISSTGPFDPPRVPSQNRELRRVMGAWHRARGVPFSSSHQASQESAAGRRHPLSSASVRGGAGEPYSTSCRLTPRSHRR
jgi:hypothetical protein